MQDTIGKRSNHLNERHITVKNDTKFSLSRTAQIEGDLPTIVEHYAKIHKGYSPEALAMIIAIRCPDIKSSVEEVQKALPKKHQVDRDWSIGMGRRAMTTQERLENRMIVRSDMLKTRGHVGVHRTNRGYYMVQFHLLDGRVLSHSRQTLELAIETHDRLERKHIPQKYRVLMRPTDEEKIVMKRTYNEIVNRLMEGGDDATD